MARLNAAIVLALFAATAACCTLQTSPSAAVRDASHSAVAASGCEPIQIVRHLQAIAPHRDGSSGDYNVEWSFSLARPALVPLVVTQRYESRAEIQDDRDDVVSHADYTEIVGFIPAGETRPVISGTAVAIDAIIEYAHANPAMPMALPNIEQFRDYVDKRLQSVSPIDRAALGAFYAAALRDYDSDATGICDHWYFTGSRLATTGSATISGRVVLYEATPELFKEIDTWEAEAGQEHLESGNAAISSADFDKLFQTSPPAPGMGRGSSGSFVSRNDEEGKPRPLSQFKELSHEVVAEQLFVTWQKTGQPVLRIAS